MAIIPEWYWFVWWEVTEVINSETYTEDEFGAFIGCSDFSFTGSHAGVLLVDCFPEHETTRAKNNVTAHEKN